MFEQPSRAVGPSKRWPKLVRVGPATWFDRQGLAARSVSIMPELVMPRQKKKKKNKFD